MQKNLGILIFLLGILFNPISINASPLSDLERLKIAYPDHIQAVSLQYVVWKDGTKMRVDPDNSIMLSHKSSQEKLEDPTLADQVIGVYYPAGKLGFNEASKQKTDPGRIRYLPFFQKMYGSNQSAVEKNLVTIYWMPLIFEKNYPLRVTTVNHIDKKLKSISDELEKLPPRYHKFLINPGGTFSWRQIANTKRLSPHSFGMTIDINTDYSNYWQWDLKKAGLAVNKQLVNENNPLPYQNQIPWEIVEIFEKHGFIWGGKWHHYDTMHFEYRPEIVTSAPSPPTPLPS